MADAAPPAAPGRPDALVVAARHGHRLARLLVRRDGSTAQSAHMRRADGRVRRIHTHQGLSAASTRARGQAWAVYGVADLGRTLRDPGLVRVARRAASYVARRLPRAGVPRWDYDARAGAPIDVSAGVITAAGLLRLDAACRALPAACPGRPWRRLAGRMLAAAVAHASRRPPLGRLGAQVYSLGGRFTWDDDAE